MLMALVDDLKRHSVYPEIAGARVLITGLTHRFGVDIARAFADHHAHLNMQTPLTTPEVAEVVALLGQTAADIALHEMPLDTRDASVKFAQGPAQKTFGGLDNVVNLIPITSEDMQDRTSLDDIEDLVSEKLLPATLITRITANRMRLTHTNGAILNVVALPQPRHDHEATIAALISATLAAMTRKEADAWADQAIRINAVCPTLQSITDLSAPQLKCEPEIASLALYMASHYGTEISGHLFDAASIIKDEF